MHIVHVLTRLLRAGSEENILLTSAGQIADGHDVTLMFGTESSPVLVSRLAPEARLFEIPSMGRPIRPAADVSAYRELRDAFRFLRPDVVHTHQSKAGILARLAARAARVSCIVHGVHILPFLGVGRAKRRLYLGAERLAARATHGYIHVSQGMLDACRTHDVGQRVPHAIIRSGFDIDRFRRATPPEDAADIRGGGAKSNRSAVLLMVAALEHRKRHLGLLDALAPILRAAPDVRLVFAGEGPLRAEITAQAQRLGISDAVRILGYREDAERVIAMSDICLLASGQEGLPRSVLQYLTAGKPTVLFDLPGLAEVISPGHNALVVDPDDWAGFGAAVQTLLTDDACRSRIGRAAADTDLSAWDWTTMGRRTTEFYRALGPVER